MIIRHFCIKILQNTLCGINFKISVLYEKVRYGFHPTTVSPQVFCPPPSVRGQASQLALGVMNDPDRRYQPPTQEVGSKTIRSTGKALRWGWGEA